MKQKRDYGDILKKKKLSFNNEKQLKKYYDQKYASSGYANGLKRFGINVSNLYHKKRWENSVKLLNPRKDEIILDAGCGDGVFTKKISKNCKEIFGVDISSVAIKKAREKTLRNCHFKQGSVETLPFEKDKFDKIICVETLEHILHPEKAVAEFRRILKPGGIVVICVPTLNKNIIASLKIRLKLSKFFEVSEHLQEYSLKDIKDLLGKEGFSFERAVGIGFNMGLPSKVEQLNKTFYLSLLKLKLKITRFPRNSSFVSTMFKNEKGIRETC